MGSAASPPPRNDHSHGRDASRSDGTACSREGRAPRQGEAGRHSGTPTGQILGYWVPLGVWLGVMLYFTSVPNPMGELLGRRSTTGTDLAGHAFGFFVLMLLLTRALRCPGGRRRERALAWAALACVTYSLFDELHQIPIRGRGFELVDLAADGVGVAIGASVMALIGRRSTARP